MFLYLAQIIRQWILVLSCTGGTQHSAPLSPLYAAQKKVDEDNILSSDVERLKKKLIQTLRFDSPPPRMSAFTSESHFPTPYTMQFERISRLFNMLLFFPSFLTNSSAHADTSSACWVPLPSLPQFQRKSCKGRTEPP